MGNYAKSLPRDQGDGLMQEYPAPILAKNVYGSENASASSVITLGHDTTAVEIGGVGNAAVMKWITTGNTNPSVISAAATVNFDHLIPTGTFRRFVVPIETANVNPGSVQGINRALGLFQRVAIKSIGTASVLLAEY